MSEVTRILSRLEEGDPRASEELFPLVYNELRRLAQTRMNGERRDHTLQATALVNEAYLKLVGGEASASWKSEIHFFSAASEAMRRILVDYARHKLSQKQGGDFVQVELDDAVLVDNGKPAEILALNRALEDFEVRFPDHAKLVKLRFFAGLTAAGAAAKLGQSKATCDRHWAFARAWLRREMLAN